MVNQAQKIIIIEDDPDIAELVQIHLGDLGYELDWVGNGYEGLERVEDNSYALVILDLMLPGLDGFEVCKRIRAGDKYTPILMLTAKSEELDKVLGLELGADDYLTKPFSIRELVARVKAIFRRIEAEKEKVSRENNDEYICFSNLEIFISKRKVLLSGRPIELTAREFDLLVQFATNPGRAYSRQELLDLVWGYQFDGYDHTVNSHINRLRNKIEPSAAEPKFIKTVWGVGYRFVEKDELEDES